MIFKSEFKADPAVILKHMGYPEGRPAPEKVMDRLMHLVGEASVIQSPTVYYDEFVIEAGSTSTELRFSGMGLSLFSKFAFKALESCDAVLMGVATLEKKIQTSKGAEPGASEQLILDSIENAALESLLEDFWNHLVLKFREADTTGLTRIYLPGENEWPLTDQKTVFSLLRLKEPGLSVQLNDSLMMMPEKSLSFIIGKTRDGNFSDVHHDCTLCTLERCQFRKKPSTHHRLIVNDISGRHEFYIEGGQSLLNAVIEKGYNVDNACGGNGTCGKCRVRVDESLGLEPGEAEKTLLNQQNLAAEERLMCFITLDRDMEINLSHQTLKPQIMVEGTLPEGDQQDPWVEETIFEFDPTRLKDQRGFLDSLLSSVEGADGMSVKALTNASKLLSGKAKTLMVTIFNREIIEIRETETTGGATYGVAVDIGTTTLAAYLYHHVTGNIVATVSALNPQSIRGKDVMTRIHYVATNETGARELSVLLNNEINNMIGGLTQKSGIDRDNIVHVVATGNTTMLHLMLGIDCGLMGISPFMPMFTSSLTLPAADLELKIHQEGKLTVLPSKAAFIGADTIAAIYSAGICSNNKVQLLIDIGTNGEIVLAGKDRILCCATAAGPAFEGGAISYGMGGVDGAIDQVNFSWSYKFTTLGGVAPKGICGSGLIDLCAELLRHDKLTSSGRLLERDEKDRFLLDEVSGISISQKDIREIQLAKGAIHAAVQILMTLLDIGPNEIDQVYLAGGFGSYLDLNNAEEIKLIPEGLISKAKVIGNAAGMGAVATLRSKRTLSEMIKIKERMEYIELSGSAEFQQVFIAKLSF
jgi:uncharacterized 2Fe-2S/4Fe-4S cluster protein (DUF4445 family)